MAGAFDVTAALPVLKEYYTGQVVSDLTYKNRPAWAWIPKRTDVGGKVYPQPATIANIGGRSRQFGEAVSARGPTQHVEWLLTHSDNFATATLEHKVTRLLKNDKGGFLRQAQTEIDSAMRAFGNDMAFGIYRDGTGVRGVVNGAPVGNVITLATSRDRRHFDVGMTLEHAATATGAIVAAEYPTVVAIDYNRVTDVATIEVSAIGTIAAGSFLFQRGDAPNNTTARRFLGFSAWMPDPATITAGDNFFGVDRSVDKSKLLGVYIDATGSTVEDAIIDAGAEVFDNEGRPDVCFIHPTRYATLAKSLENRGRFDKVASDDARVFFESITVNTGAGPVQVMADPYCPVDEGYMLQRDTWEVFSTDPLPSFIHEDGATLARLLDANEHEFRIGGYGNTYCSAPGWNARIINL